MTIADNKTCVAAWGFDYEVQGADAINSAKNYLGHNDLTDTGSCTRVAFGISSGTVYFNPSSDQRLSLDDASQLFLGLTMNKWTLTTRAYPIMWQVGYSPVILSKEIDGGERSFRIWYNEARKYLEFVISADGSNTTTIDLISRPSGASWIGITITFDGDTSEIKAYANGSLVSTTSWGTLYDPGTYDFAIGALGDGTLQSRFWGYVDDTAILSKVAAQWEVTQLWSYGLAMKPPALRWTEGDRDRFSTLAGTETYVGTVRKNRNFLNPYLTNDTVLEEET